MVTVSPALFCTTQTLLTVLGANVTVQACDKEPVRVSAIALAASEAPSAIVMVAVEASDKASEPLPKASAISSRFVLVTVPHVPLASPVAISLSLRSFTYVLAIFYPLLPR